MPRGMKPGKTNNPKGLNQYTSKGKSLVRKAVAASKPKISAAKKAVSSAVRTAKNKSAGPVSKAKFSVASKSFRAKSAVKGKVASVKKKVQTNRNSKNVKKYIANQKKKK